MKNIAHRTIIQDHHLAQVRLYGTEVLDIGAIPKCTVLPIISTMEVLAFLLEPVDDGICIFLDTSGKYDQFIPFAHFAEKVVAMRAFMDVVQDGVLRPNRGRGSPGS